MNGFMYEALYQIGLMWCAFIIIGSPLYLVIDCAIDCLRARKNSVLRERGYEPERRKNASQRKRERCIEEDALRFINRDK